MVQNQKLKFKHLAYLDWTRLFQIQNIAQPLVRTCEKIINICVGSRNIFCPTANTPAVKIYSKDKVIMMTWQFFWEAT
jgi:hypothetical protein